ncbi:gamma-aminobutyric acid receptor subunit rho-3-like isoform X1 [Amphibalanus amphitrite]|uniref:gamma-aminobutyric acid receptor subunit rho-3-like isoform X1 n=2 Tax=Amphibalanus amphitrite TaxID=1232801 RepID=UPI001C920794|nr:gamma-aminobutyric acid receptor subunit rho-3-like isoform X1 [Amphibalanus amphitrite]
MSKSKRKMRFYSWAATSAPYGRIPASPCPSGLYVVRSQCYFTYERYPMDKQRCKLRLQTYMYTDDVMLVSWHHSGVELYFDTRPRSFNVDDVRIAEPEVDYTLTGALSEVSFEVLLTRKVRNSVLSVFVPSFMLIFVSWLSLWVPPELVPGRMVLVITTLLTLTGLFNANVQSMPEVSYVKALDIWNLTCIVFVLFTIVEYIVVLRLSYTDSSSPQVVPEKNGKAAWTLEGRWTGKDKAALLEKGSRAFLPVAFFIFNIAYWSYYLNDSQE